MQASNSSQFDGTVDVNANGTDNFDLTFTNSTVTSSGTDIGFTLDIGTNVTDADVTISNTNITSANARALQVSADSVDTVNFLLTTGTLANNSADATVEIDSSGATTFNANIRDMMFNNAGAGDDFDMASNDTDSEVNLHLDNNTADSGAGDFVLRNPAGNATTNFEIQDRDTVESRNSGSFTYDSAANALTDFGDIPGPVPTP